LTDTIKNTKLPFYSKTQQVAGIVREKDRQIESWRMKCFDVKGQTASQASLIEELRARDRELLITSGVAR
jgi:hypothetical protein